MHDLVYMYSKSVLENMQRLLDFKKPLENTPSQSNIDDTKLNDYMDVLNPKFDNQLKENNNQWKKAKQTALGQMQLNFKTMYENIFA